MLVPFSHDTGETGNTDWGEGGGREVEEISITVDGRGDISPNWLGLSHLPYHWGDWEHWPVILNTHCGKILPSLSRLNPADVEERKFSWQRLTGLLRTYERLYCTDQVFLLEVSRTSGWPHHRSHTSVWACILISYSRHRTSFSCWQLSVCFAYTTPYGSLFSNTKCLLPRYTQMQRACALRPFTSNRQNMNGSLTALCDNVSGNEHWHTWSEI